MYNVQGYGTNHNVSWNLANTTGYEFEDKIYKIALKELKQYLLEDKMTVEQTRRSNDGGKDIVIISKTDFVLFGISFELEGKDKITIYLETKSTDKQLRFEKAIGNIVRSKYDKIDYFALVTNSTINPNAYYLFEHEFHDSTQFVLIDQYFLAKSINSKHLDIFGRVPEYMPQNDNNDNFYLEYQITPYSHDGESGFEITFMFRNYSFEEFNCKLSLATNVNWSMAERILEFIIPPNYGVSKKIHLKNDNSDEFNSLMFNLEKNSHDSLLKVQSINLSETFEPPFVSEERKNICTNIIKNIKRPNGNRMFFLWGESGIGKTRIVHRVFDEVNNSLFDIFECHVKDNNQDTINKIIEFLNKKEYTSKEQCNLCEFADVIKDCDNQIKTAVILIDDFHYATKKFLDQIKSINNNINQSVAFIICGRTDYSFGNSDYYSFVNWSNDNMKRNENLWEIEPLKDDETKNLIKAMINGVPEKALDILFKKSKNNPLFIVQYIEYLIGEKLAYIVNRNAVGIIDLSKFNTKCDIPEKISEIYSLRINNLRESEKNADELLKFLLVLAAYKGEIPSDVICKFYDDYTLTSILVKKRFIMFENGFYRFVHESLMIYFQQLLKKEYAIEISKYILSISNDVRETFSPHQLGRLFIWNGDKKNAAKQFKDIVNAINNVDNISNIRIDINMYDYIYDVFKVYEDDKENVELLKKLLETRIYITLHHMKPYNAALECNYCLDLISNNNILKNEKHLYNCIMAEKAHALMNSGKNFDGYLVLNELQSKWIVNNNNFDDKALFDIYDRLLASYIKFNCFNTAQNYAKLEMDVTKQNKNMEAIANRTQSKLYYLKDYDKCIFHLDEVDEIMQTHLSERIKTNNQIYRFVVELTYDKINDYDQAKKNLNEIIDFSQKNNFNRAIIQGNLVLASMMMKSEKKNDIKVSLQLIDSAINNSIAFGINGYLWQLYNLKAICRCRLGAKANEVMQLFRTVFEILINQDLNFIGSKDLCYSNILAISNVGIFFYQHSTEDSFNSLMSQIKYFGDITIDDQKYRAHRLNINEMRNQYIRAEKKEVFFVKKQPKNILRDNETGFFIALT
nr:AAA family ATPase [Methanobrevibacter smithii]